jgi:hypothetical protein
MKQRLGFVSNSSSSSFVIRGVKTSEGEIVENVKKAGLKVYDRFSDIPEEERGLYMYEGVSENLDIQSTRYFFGGDETDECVVGKSLSTFDDGEVVELPEGDQIDAEVVEELKTLGINVKPSELRTYIQYISNDNY